MPPIHQQQGRVSLQALVEGSQHLKGGRILASSLVFQKILLVTGVYPLAKYLKHRWCWTVFQLVGVGEGSAGVVCGVRGLPTGLKKGLTSSWVQAFSVVVNVFSFCSSSYRLILSLILFCCLFVFQSTDVLCCIENGVTEIRCLPVKGLKVVGQITFRLC